MADDMIKKIPLGEAYEFRSGLSKPRASFGSGYPFLTFKDVFDNTFLPSSLGDLVRSTEKDRIRCDIRRGDVFLTRTSETMDELGMSSVALTDYPEATFNGFTKRLRPTGKIEIVPEYAAYYFRSPRFRSKVTAMSSLSTRASLNNDILNALTIELPDIDVQFAIGDCLRSFDDRIDHIRRTARVLERLARAIFKAWFVDFEPVKARAEGATSFPSMPQDVFEALPTTFVSTEIGLVPNGWDVKAIGDVVTVKGGATPSTKNPEYWDDGTFCFATPKDLSGLSEPILLDTGRHITQAGVERISSGVLPAGTVLMSSRAPIGYLALAGVPTAVNQGFIAMICDGPLPPTYVLNWAHFSMPRIKGRAGGTTFPEISKKNFRPIKLVVPLQECIHSFQELVDSMFSLIEALVIANHQLAEMRDYLLPKLMSGEVQIDEAEELAAEAT